MSKTIAVIDGNSLMHRAYHAVPPTMMAPDGTPTNAAFGFMAMLIRFIEDESPDAIVCAFDKGKPTYRIELLAQYKAQRPPMDEELRLQFPVIEKLLEALDIPILAIPGWEGDDVLGTISAECERLGYRSLLVTGDKDAYQLASDLTRIVTTKRGITDVMIYGPSEVEKRYGVTPEQFTDYLGLKGDKVDNIPGVPGIGDKRAAALLQKYGNLEGIYEHLEDFKGKQYENLSNNKDNAFLSRKVATIIRDAPISIDLSSITFPDFDPQKVIDAFSDVRFMSHLSKILAFYEGLDVSPTFEINFSPVLEGSQATEALDKLLEEGKSVFPLAWSLDKQGSLFDEGFNLAIGLGEQGSAYLQGETARNYLKTIVQTARFVAFDCKTLLEKIYPADTSIQALISLDDLLHMESFDVALAAYVINSQHGGRSLLELAEHYLNTLVPKQENDQDALAQDAAIIGLLAGEMRKRLEQDGIDGVYDNIDHPLIAVLANMERCGTALDRDHLAEIAVTTQTLIDSIREDIYQQAGVEFNIDSPKQLSHVLFDVLKLTPIKKNHRGYSTDARVLSELAKVNPLPEKVLEYREYAKIKSTYIDALPKMCAGDKRLHTSFNEMVTTTGRLSSSDPNLQNIPVRTDFGRHIRECFVPLRENDVFLSADYSQIELRLLAHLSKDRNLIDAFLSGEDFHARTASRVFDIPIEEVTPTLRSRAKAVNFGIVYGQQAYGLSQSLDIPFADAKEMIDRYFIAYPDVRRFLDEVVAHAKDTGYAETLYGRRRYIPELQARNAAQRAFGERTAMNHPMQGTAADIIKMAMRRVQEELIAQKFSTQLVLQVHDELDFSVPKDELEDVSSMVKSIMENVVSLSVPLVCDVSSGPNWALAH